jgi:hypothetical protein
MSTTTHDIQTAFDTELNRLLALGLSPELETLARRYYSDKSRDAMDSSDFCGPHQSFPVKTQEDALNAAHLAGHADNPDAVRACIKRKAKANGWKLPDSWQDDKDDAKDRSIVAEAPASSETFTSPDVQVMIDGKTMLAATTSTNVIADVILHRAAGTNHDPFTGTHSHAHPAFGSQGDDDMHEHEHSHDGDSDHRHSHAETSDESKDRSVGHMITPESLSVYLPITRVDATSRMVTGQATVEKPDAYGTIFGYYPDAWLKWRGNMREQHDPKKAVGKAIEVIPDDQERAIYVTSKVSRGAQDTWLKIEDGVLSGYSASIIPDEEFGNDPRKWPKKQYEGREYPYLPRYTVAETSYVDNPATPGCNISLVRADGFLSEVIDTTVEEAEEHPRPVERAGARVSGATRVSNHKSIGHTLRAAISQMQNCGGDCPQCQAAMKIIDPDSDGDIDLGGYDDSDGDWQSLYHGKQEDMERVVTELIERALQPVYMRFQGIAGTLARNNTLPTNIDSLISSSISRAFEAIDAKLTALPTQSSLDEVRTELSVVKGQVDRIAEQPMPGGPILNANAMPRAIEKQLPTDPPYAQPRPSMGSVYDAIATMSRQGQLDTEDKQVDAMYAGLLAQRRR